MAVLRDLRLFLREFHRSFPTTGAIVPSGPSLSAALARPALQIEGRRRVLEVGPGTGVVTRCLARGWRSDDRLDLVEINPAFADRIREKLTDDADFRSLNNGTRILCAAIEEAELDPPYGAVVSGLPLNNFSAEAVRRILDVLTSALGPGGTLSFFEYAGIRRAKQMAAGGDQRRRLQGIGRELSTTFAGHDYRRETIWLNIPPAWVHHLRPRDAEQGPSGCR